MNRGNARRHIFLSKKHYLHFLNLLDLVAQKYGLEIHAFCLMGTHYHLLVHTPQNNLSSAIQYLNSRFAMAVNKERKRDGFVFKGRFKSLLIANKKYLLNVGRYIHLNPVESGISKKPEDYEWSSCRDYLQASPRYPWLKTSHVQPNSDSYDTYLKKGNPRKMLDLYSKQRLPNRIE